VLSIGGKDIPANKSVVPRYKHEAWHRFFDNLAAVEVMRLFWQYYELFGKGVKSKAEAQFISKVIRSDAFLTEKKIDWQILG